MNVRMGSGWQTVLADLSLILFMVTAAAVSQASPQPSSGEALALGEPVAVWRPGSLSPPPRSTSPWPCQCRTLSCTWTAL